MTYVDTPLARHMLSGYRASLQKRPHVLGPARQQQPPPNLDDPSREKPAQWERSLPRRESQIAMATQWALLGRVGKIPTST